MVPSRGCSISSTTPRATICGCSNTSWKLLTRAQGTPASISAASSSPDFIVRMAGSTSASSGVLVGLAVGVGGKARIGELRAEPDRLHELLEQHVVRRADRDVALVARFEQLIGRGEAVPVAHRLRHLAGFEIFRRLPGRRRDRGLDQRNVGDAAFAVPRRADEARQRRVGRKQRAEHVGGLHARPHRHLARLAGHRQHAGERLDDQIDAGAPPVRPGLAEARHRRVDDLRIDRLQLLGAEPHLLQRARPVGLDEHVGLRARACA